jgi:hypothetical protein
VGVGVGVGVSVDVDVDVDADVIVVGDVDGDGDGDVYDHSNDGRRHRLVPKTSLAESSVPRCPPVSAMT